MVETLPILRGKRIAILGSGGELGVALAAAAEAAGADVLGICGAARFDHISELYRFDPADPAAMDAVARALPDDLNGLVLMPWISSAPVTALLDHTLAAPRRLAEAMAPRLAPGASIVVRAAEPHPRRSQLLGAVRAGARLRPGNAPHFAKQWGLDQEPALTSMVIGWAMQAWALSRATAWPGVRVNAILPAAPDGRLTPDTVAASGRDAISGVRMVANTTLFLLSDLSQGLTGATLAADGGRSATIQTSLEGL